MHNFEALWSTNGHGWNTTSHNKAFVRDWNWTHYCYLHIETFQGLNFWVGAGGLQMPPKPLDDQEAVWKIELDMVWDSPVKHQKKLMISEDNEWF
jgi:hypothetical protein